MKNFKEIEEIEQKMHLIRGRKVMLEKDLEALYEVEPAVLKNQVKRNLNRFPVDFMFQLNQGEVQKMVSQNVIGSSESLEAHLPYAFTLAGVAMLSSIVHSRKAIQISIAIIRMTHEAKKLGLMPG